MLSSDLQRYHWSKALEEISHKWLLTDMKQIAAMVEYE